MKKLILSTGSDLNYLGRIQPYLNSIIQNSNFDDNILVYLNDENLISNNDKIKISKITPNQIDKPNINNCLQHGEFIKSEYFLNSDDNDVIFFTDGDIIIQRNLTEEEQIEFRNLQDGDVYVGYNASPTDTLLDESNRLGLKGIINENDQILLSNTKVYNTGVLAMNKKTWLCLVDYYKLYFDVVENMFEHYAKQQWLISYIIGTENFNIIEMPYYIHNHKHYPSPVGTHQDNNGIVYYDNKVVLFKHKWD